MSKISCSFKYRELCAIKHSLEKTVKNKENLINLVKNNPDPKAAKMVKELKIDVAQEHNIIYYVDKKIQTVKNGIYRS